MTTIIRRILCILIVLSCPFWTSHAGEMPSGELRSGLENLLQSAGANATICKTDVPGKDAVCGFFVQSTSEDFFTRLAAALEAKKSAGLVGTVGSWFQSGQRFSSWFSFRGVIVDVQFFRGSTGGDFVLSAALDAQVKPIKANAAQLAGVVEKFFVSNNLVNAPCPPLRVPAFAVLVRCGTYRYKPEVFALDLEAFFKSVVPARAVRPWDGKNGVFDLNDGSRFYVLLDLATDGTLTVVFAAE
jgi:hypothetical protein